MTFCCIVARNGSTREFRSIKMLAYQDVEQCVCKKARAMLKLMILTYVVAQHLDKGSPILLTLSMSTSEK